MEFGFLILSLLFFWNNDANQNLRHTSQIKTVTAKRGFNFHQKLTSNNKALGFTMQQLNSTPITHDSRAQVEKIRKSDRICNLIAYYCYYHWIITKDYLFVFWSIHGCWCVQFFQTGSVRQILDGYLRGNNYYSRLTPFVSRISNLKVERDNRWGVVKCAIHTFFYYTFVTCCLLFIALSVEIY